MSSVKPNVVRIKLKDKAIISLIQIEESDANFLGIKGFIEDGSVEAALLNVNKEGYVTGIGSQPVLLKDAEELLNFISKVANQ